MAPTKNNNKNKKQQNSNKRFREDKSQSIESTPENQAADKQTTVTDYFKTTQPTDYDNLAMVINETHKNTEKLLLEIESLKSDMLAVKRENEKLKEENFSLLNMINNLEQYGRRSNLRVFGVAEDKNENTDSLKKIILDLFVKKLRLKIDNDFIDIIHRVGRPKENMEKPRAIIIRFSMRKYAGLILANRKKLKGSGIVIAEDLTKANAKLYNDCRRNDTFTDVWTKNGSVMAKRRDGKIEKILHTKFNNGFDPKQKYNNQGTNQHSEFRPRPRPQPENINNNNNDISESVPVCSPPSIVERNSVNLTFTTEPTHDISNKNNATVATTSTATVNTPLNVQPTGYSTPKNIFSQNHVGIPSH